MTSPLHCSEAFCDLHDFQINTSGICLRQDALRRSEITPRSGSPGEDLAAAIVRLGEIVERMERRQPKWSPPPTARPIEPPRREARRGGTPL